ncbi:alpha/beta hydrolase [Pokkaliibacter sp. MBI-7]|uniref:alpha/beta hydrolase n=1 Tax=Pokkaliibacter sp. MBI-7 TaxID=3040600 RepID=UPI002448EBCC|nr:alpha/beta hydrolase [Pokkaliibacter sp. MBI-7]MDH2433702.1 alpha/beta hydrolase [Pokkaliibacter sp. MBI-7]
MFSLSCIVRAACAPGRGVNNGLPHLFCPPPGRSKGWGRQVVRAGVLMLLLANAVMAQTALPGAQAMPVSVTQTWDKVFPQSPQVDHQKVSFENRYGIRLVADLYMPKGTDKKLLAALVVAGPFGSVKEQVSGLYAQKMAERGYLTLAFDPSYTGESGGEPRNLASAEINTDDVSAAVDYLGLLDSVDRQRIGVIGICGGGGMSLNAAAIDTRIRAVVTASMYDISRLMARGYYDAMSHEARAGMVQQLSEQRWRDAEQGRFADGPPFLPDTLEGVTDPVVKMYFDYYRTPRGYHPRSVNSRGAFTATMPLSFMNMPMLTHIDEISPRPVLFIAGAKAHSRYFSEDAYKAAAEPKQLLIVGDAIHTDLYDRVDKIPFDAITAFFDRSLH